MGLGEEGESKTGGRDGRKRIRNKGLGKGTKDEMVTGKEELQVILILASIIFETKGHMMEAMQR